MTDSPDAHAQHILVLEWNAQTGAIPYLTQLHHEIGRTGMKLVAAVAKAKDDVEAWLNGSAEEALANLNDPSSLDHNRLAGRKTMGGVRKIKPRIDLVATFTRAGDLSVFWQPTRWKERGSEVQDWIEFRHGSYGKGRPANELMHVRGARALRDARAFPDETKGAAMLMSMAIVAAQESLAERLGTAFEVCRKSGSDIELDDAPGPKGIVRAIATWDICDAARRADEEKRAFVAAFEANYGLSVETMLALALPLAKGHAEAALTIPERCAARGWTRAAEALAADWEETARRVLALADEGYVVDGPTTLPNPPPVPSARGAVQPPDAAITPAAKLEWRGRLNALTFNDRLMVSRINEAREKRGQPPHLPEGRLTQTQRATLVEELMAIGK